jgi:alcohol dehydrogenase (NADP+)
MSTMYQAKAYSAASKTSPLASASIPRRDTTARDVQIEILFCGVCHSDLHQARDEWNTVRNGERGQVRCERESSNPNR